MIKTVNKGPVVVSSSYWGSHHEQEGYYYLTPNAGWLRLLCPRACGEIGEMATGKIVGMTFGIVRSIIKAGMVVGKEMIEIMFDDQTASPFVLYLDVELMERSPASGDFGRKLKMSVWEDRRGKPHRILARTCYLRRADLPCLRACK